MEPPSAWSLVYEAFDPAREGMREALCALGNGYFATRGAAAWARADGIHYPGTYLAGGYNRLRTDIAGRVVENEDLVNFPNWLAARFASPMRTGSTKQGDAPVVPPGARSPARHAVADHDLRGRPGAAHTLKERLVSMSDMHLGALELALTAENWSATSSSARRSMGASSTRAPSSIANSTTHLEPLTGEVVGEDGVCLLVRTCQSNLHVAQAARTRAFRNGELLDSPRRPLREPGYIGQEFEVPTRARRDAGAGEARLVYTSRDQAISEPGWRRARRSRAQDASRR